MEKEYINEVAWCKIFSFLRSVKNIYSRNEKKSKRFIEAVFWMARTDAQWRELHGECGKWNSVFTRFNAWSKKKIWHDLHMFCIEDPDLEPIMIDSTIARAHACAAGYKKGQQAEEGLGRSKGGFTTKIHVKVDALGNPLQFINTPGQISDITQSENLIADAKNYNVLADKGFDSDDFRFVLEQKGCTSVIPGRSNRKIPIVYDKNLYKERHLVECFFAKMKQFRHVFSRFDKSMRNFMSFLAFLGAILWLR